MKKKITLIILGIIAALSITACDGMNSDTIKDKENQKKISNDLVGNQPTPTDISYSLERYNLIKRAYWVNGMREKAMSLPCAVDRPLGYIVLLTDNGSILGRFIVDGKVSSLNSFLTPDSDYYEYNSGSYTCKNEWLADVDGSYGENDKGIFFFTTDGKYIEWTGRYLYSDIPFEVDEPILKIGE